MMMMMFNDDNDDYDCVESFFSSFPVDWMLLIYKDGEKYNSYCDKQSREAWVKIVCDKTGKVLNFSLSYHYHFSTLYDRMYIFIPRIFSRTLAVISSACQAVFLHFSYIFS